MVRNIEDDMIKLGGGIWTVCSFLHGCWPITKNCIFLNCYKLLGINIEDDMIKLGWGGWTHGSWLEYRKLYLFELLQNFEEDMTKLRGGDLTVCSLTRGSPARKQKLYLFLIFAFGGKYKVGMMRNMDRLFVDTGISGQEAVDVFTWTDATLIRLLQLQKKKTWKDENTCY